MHAEDRAQEKIAEFVRYAISSDLDKLREMITKRKMNPNAKDRFGMNAIHWVRGKSIKVVEMLLKLGADPNLRNEVSFSSKIEHPWKNWKQLLRQH
ncbi:hypothetical protein JG688_00000539 [Phytophthora aleatoria]|uniref:Ankyrin repeat domain-containing protein n=1 Tax=Phytophthora aleatoria TaxID=2496075 RepID=A0A8J5MIL4_9STRA|nr:hypothetical protein JG688_00000539 [Phytophthora aleatoria]